MLRSTSVRALVLGAMLISGRASAQAVDEPGRAPRSERALDVTGVEAERSVIARALFMEGLFHAREERFADAADCFARAQAIRPTPPIAFNLASALARIGRLLEAAEQLQDILRDESIDADLREAARVMIERIEVRLPRVRIVLAGAREGAVLQLDDNALAAAVIDAAVPVNPGTHRVAVLRGGEEVASAALELAEGAFEEVVLAFSEAFSAQPALGDGAPRTSAPPRSIAPDLEWLLWTGAIVLVAGMAAVMTTVIVLEQESAPAEPVPGTTIPAILEWD